MRVFAELCPTPPRWDLDWARVREALPWVRDLAGVEQDPVHHVRRLVRQPRVRELERRPRGQLQPDPRNGAGHGQHPRQGRHERRGSLQQGQAEQ